MSLMSKCNITTLAEIVKRSTNRQQILSELGYKSGTGSMTKQLYKLLDANNIDYSHIRSGLGWAKGSKMIIKNVLDPSVVLTSNSTHGRGVAKRCVIRNNLIEYKCIECGNIGSWNNKPITLILDHINGINNDHRLDNLRFLCPNCNSQTDTFGSRNIKNKLYCSECNCQVSNNTKCGKCIICLHKYLSTSQPSKSPTREELSDLIWKYPATTIAEMFGVSETTIRKWCKKFQILKPGTGYWSKRNK